MALPLLGRFVAGRVIFGGEKDRPQPKVDAKVSFNVTSNAKAWRRGMTRLQKQQMPFAMSMALNMTAADVAKTQRRQAGQVFDRPTPFLLNGMAPASGKTFRGKRATKRILVAKVIPGYKKSGLDAAGRRVNNVLRIESEGGTRRASGNAIPVPVAKNLKLNKHGNLRNGQVKRILNQKKTFQAGAAEGMTPGIYQRKPGGGQRMLVAYTKTASYRKRLPFHRIGEGVAGSKMRKNFNQAMARALKSAK